MGNCFNISIIPVASSVEKDNIITVSGIPYILALGYSTAYLDNTIDVSAPTFELVNMPISVLNSVETESSFNLQDISQKKCIKMIKLLINDCYYNWVITILQNREFSVRNLFIIARYIQEHCLSNSVGMIRALKIIRKNERIKLQKLLEEKIEEKIEGKIMCCWYIL